jgi:cellulose synthase/poly-beta-1,6-N-acetylglucosamine synthase-like glycosyltransferase
MPVLWSIAVILVFLYLLWIGYFFHGWLGTPVCCANLKTGTAFVSVIIPVRNEEANIEYLLNDLVRQDYSAKLIDIIIVDDHSSDLTPLIVGRFSKNHTNIRLISLGETKSGKKSAMKTGVHESRFPLILTTDADCRLPSNWVTMMVNCFELNGSDLIAGPVIIIGGSGFLSRFQQLEMFSLVGSTAGSITTGNPVMCNAANLGFKKEAYLASENPSYDKFSSGDDVFLLHEMQGKGRKISFLKHGKFFVTTHAEPDLSGFLNQRKRWTSKSLQYRSKPAIYTAILIFLINIYAVILFLCGLSYPGLLIIAMFIFILKSAIDFPFLYSVTGFFGRKNLMWYFPVIQIVYFFYISFTVIFAFTSGYNWKGRVVK